MWIPQSNKRGDRQTAYRIRVFCTDGGALVCDTGWVSSDQCFDIPLDMKPEPLTNYRYTVEALDAENQPAVPAEGSFWGAMRGRRFTAKWITGHNCLKKDLVQPAHTAAFALCPC